MKFQNSHQLLHFLSKLISISVLIYGGIVTVSPIFNKWTIRYWPSSFCNNFAIFLALGAQAQKKMSNYSDHEEQSYQLTGLWPVLLTELHDKPSTTILIIHHILIVSLEMNANIIDANIVIASQCAYDRSKFWNFYKLLFHNQEEENSGGLSDENLRRIALKMSIINLHELIFCLNDKKPKAFVENDTNFAFVSWLHGKPTLLVEKPDVPDQELLVRACPFQSIRVVIDKKIS